MRRGLGDGGRHRVAGFWRRVVAASLDAVMVAPLGVLFGGASSAIAGGGLPRLHELGLGYVVHLVVDDGPAGITALATAAIVAFLYLVIFVATTGQTPGKRLLRVRVVDAYGDPPSVVRSFLRASLLVVSVALFGLGWLWVGFSREKRGLHDLLAGTYAVIVERPGAALPAEAVLS